MSVRIIRIFHQAVTVLTLIGFVLLQGCTTTRQIPVAEYQDQPQWKKSTITGAELVDGQSLRFNLAHGNAEIKADTIMVPAGAEVYTKVPLSQVKTLRLTQTDAAKTLIFIGAAAVTTVVVLYISAINSMSPR